MRVTKSNLEYKVSIVNYLIGKEDSEPGSVRYYKDATGYAIHQLHNESGGVRNLSGHGLSAREAYLFLCGMIEAIERFERQA